MQCLLACFAKPAGSIRCLHVCPWSRPPLVPPRLLPTSVCSFLPKGRGIEPIVAYRWVLWNPSTFSKYIRGKWGQGEAQPPPKSTRMLGFWVQLQLSKCFAIFLSNLIHSGAPDHLGLYPECLPDAHVTSWPSQISLLGSPSHCFY